ncbi:hypothetical protein R6V09_49500, partial [Streptomyces sp. W16]|uniref:hypothetical protein n=1 Tax=Streptomyces sp. W16 TaxID=3076631 RepID=UPI00295AC337
GAAGHQRPPVAADTGTDGCRGVAGAASPEPMRRLHDHTPAISAAVVQPLSFFAPVRGLRRR